MGTLCNKIASDETVSEIDPVDRCELSYGMN